MTEQIYESTRLERIRRQFAKVGGALVPNFPKIMDPQTGYDTGVGNGSVNNGNGNGSTCFLKGTRIRTANGDLNVEDLQVGDLLATLSGSLRPIQLIQSFGYKRSHRKAWTKDILPVYIAPSALAPNVPAAGVFLSQAHALYIDGFLVPVRRLINNMSIYLAREFEELEYFHITLESSNVVYAEGMPCALPAQQLRS